GKSTFCRMICNSLLNKYKKVGFMELDPYASEFSPNGLLTFHLVEKPLLGPAYTHLMKANKSYFFGHSQVGKDVNYYIACCMCLLFHYRKNFRKSVPLVINTAPSYLDGAGYHTLLE